MDYWLPVVFAGLMALAMLIYVVLDGYDLGVGVLLNGGDDNEKDMMIASIGPFWDANETWLVLGIGILLIAFPMAHGIILSSLYLEVAVMLVGLTLRGVAFDFRVKAREPRKPLWNAAFFGGSLLAALAQGFMLGHYISGFENSVGAYAFSDADKPLRRGGLLPARCNLADHEKRTRAAAKSGALGTGCAVVYGRRNCGGIHRNAAHQHARLRQVVFVSTVPAVVTNTGYIDCPDTCLPLSFAKAQEQH